MRSLLQRAVSRFGAWVVISPLLIVFGLLLDRERTIGGLAWTFLTAILMYRLGLWIIGPFLLPIEDTSESRASLRAMLQRHASGGQPTMAMVRDGKVLPEAGGKPRREVKGEGIVFVDSTSVVALATDTRVTRVLPSGVHFMRKDEQIAAVVDLRLQNRTEKVTAQTRDGIWITFDIKLRFRIDGVESRFDKIDLRQVARPTPYVWSARQVLRALDQTRVGVDEDLSTPWDKLAGTEATNRVLQHIAQYTFDELTEPQNPAVDRRAEIQKELEAEVKAALAGTGINLLGLIVTQFVPRDLEVKKQRIETWKADWVRKARVVEAEGQVERYRLVELARAQGQMELVLRITQALEASRQLGMDNPEEVALHLLDVVERLASEPDVEERLTSETREALDETHRLLGKGTDSGESEATRSG